jgi:capsular exopolysaccharide synthesis family protein
VSLDNLDQPHKVVLVTSSVAGEGKSLISLNLAVAFASAEKTLLIDGDLRRPSIGRMLGIARDKPGLSELLADNAKLADCLTTTGIENLDVLSTGFIPPDPLQMLASSRMANALKVLANTYGRIVIDCPPILPVSDAALLSKYASCLLYVVKSDATALPQIRNGLALLDRVNAPVMGLVISQLDTRKAEKNSDYGYAGYYESYSPKA